MEIIDDIMAMTAGHLPSAVAERVQCGPNSFGGFTVCHPRSWKKIEGEFVLACQAMAGKMVLSNAGDD